MSREGRQRIARTMSERAIIYELVQIDKLLKTCQSSDRPTYLEAIELIRQELAARTAAKGKQHDGKIQ